MSETKIFKIGQIVTEEKEGRIITMFNQIVNVKPGDKAIINSRGNKEYITGEARGKKCIGEDIEVKGYDTASIANLIINHLKYVGDFESALEDFDIDIKDIQESIENTLDNIL